MKIELFQNHTFSEFLTIPLPERLENIYAEIEQQKKLSLHEITLIFNGYILPYKGKCSDFQLKDSSTIRFFPQIPTTLKSITPNEGPMTGGTTVFIEGRFPYSSVRYKVLFGETSVIVDFYQFNQLKVITPSHLPGPVSVKVCYEGGEWSNGVIFTYVSPHLDRKQYTRCGNLPTTSVEDMFKPQLL